MLKKIALAAPAIGLVDVGVGVDDVRALAAELERDLLEVAGRGLDDQLADLGRAGEGDLVDVVVRGQRRARVAVAGDDVEHAVGQAGLLEQLAEAQRRERRLLGRLEDDRAAAGQRGPELPGRHQQREVPRDDLPDDADRLLEREGQVARPGWAQRERDRVALDLRRPARHVVEQVGGERDVGDARDRHRLAVVERLEQRQLVAVLEDQVAEAVHDLAALGRRHAPPRAVLVEGRACGAHRAVDVLGAALGHVREHFLGRRVDASRTSRPTRSRPTRRRSASASSSRAASRSQNPSR